MCVFTLLLLLLTTLPAAAADWPEWRGKGRAGVWSETGILEAFPEAGLKIRWRTPVKGGFSGPAMAGGRVYVTDFIPGERNRGHERILCLDEKTGKLLWTRQWEADYNGLQSTYATGPRATPTVDGDRVYVLGAKGMLQALDTGTGALAWKRDYVEEYGAQVPIWGMNAAPLVEGGRLIALVGGERNAKVVAFDKASGKELWRALASDSEPGYSPPVIVDRGGRRQLIVWHPFGLASLDPATGEIHWEQPFTINVGLTVATPVASGARLLVSSFYNGSMMMELEPGRPAARLLWQGASQSERNTDGLHTLINTPVIDGDYVYGICSYGQLRCLNARTGERVWETLAVTRENARWATGFLVRNGDRYFINNDRGELILAALSPQGYREISRTPLIQPTTNPGNRRELGAVHWSHPAYANRHIIIRNDQEILSASLEK